MVQVLWVKSLLQMIVDLQGKRSRVHAWYHWKWRDKEEQRSEEEGRKLTKICYAIILKNFETFHLIFSCFYWSCWHPCRMADVMDFSVSGFYQNWNTSNKHSIFAWAGLGICKVHSSTESPWLLRPLHFIKGTIYCWSWRRKYFLSL